MVFIWARKEKKWEFIESWFTYDEKIVDEVTSLMVDDFSPVDHVDLRMNEDRVIIETNTNADGLLLRLRDRERDGCRLRLRWFLPSVFLAAGTSSSSANRFPLTKASFMIALFASSYVDGDRSIVLKTETERRLSDHSRRHERRNARLERHTNNTFLDIHTWQTAREEFDGFYLREGLHSTNIDNQPHLTPTLFLLFPFLVSRCLDDKSAILFPSKDPSSAKPVLHASSIIEFNRFITMVHVHERHKPVTWRFIRHISADVNPIGSDFGV